MKVEHKFMGQRGPVRSTETPFREWPWPARLIERLYRWTHGGQVRTLVIRDRSHRV